MKIIIMVLLFAFTLTYSEDKYTITLEPGSKYIREEFSMHIAPQISFWLEDNSGKKIKDIYVTKYFYIQVKNDMVNQPENLPVWLFKTGYDPYSQDGTKLPVPPLPKTDATSGATPRAKFSKEFSLPKKGNQFFLFAEINNSFDFNETFKRVVDRKSNAFNVANGQPSLVYKIGLARGDQGRKNLSVVGYGSALGTTGKIYTDLSVITDAKDIIKTIYVENVSR